MKTRTQKVRLGVFIFFSGAILIVVVLFFAANKLFEKSDVYYVAYHDVSVSGLEVGSPVNYLGIKIGTISNIFIDPKDIRSIIVELSLRPGTPIKKDAYADIVSLGITGLKTIEIRGGSNEAAVLKRGEFLQSGSSTSQEITGKANIIAEKAEKVINNLQLFTKPENMDKFSDAAENINILARQLNKTMQMIDTLINENRKEVREAVSTANLVATRLDTSVLILNETIAGINNIIRSDSVKQILGNAYELSQHLRETDLEVFISDLAEVTDQTRKLLYRIDREVDLNSRELSESVRLLRITLSNLEEASNKINSDPSVLLRGLGDKDIPDRRLKK
ncbi:MAG TPA: MCE family protein [Bacteroidetes bacterium]|nr:MCE family protein [Bacteroidota bacterium]